MGWTLGKNIGFCLGGQEEGLRGPAGEGSSIRIPSCSQFPPSPRHRVRTPAGARAFSKGPRFSPLFLFAQSASVLGGFPLCSFPVCAEGWRVGQRVGGVQAEALGRKERSGPFQSSVFSSEVWFGFCGVVSWPLGFNPGKPPQTPSLSPVIFSSVVWVSYPRDLSLHSRMAWGGAADVGTGTWD